MNIIDYSKSLYYINNNIYINNFLIYINNLVIRCNINDFLYKITNNNEKLIYIGFSCITIYLLYLSIYDIFSLLFKLGFIYVLYYLIIS